MVVPLLAGLVAGLITTLAGVGGGMVLLLVLSVWWDPLTALAVTAPALLIGNFHRIHLYGRRLDRAVAVRFAAGGFPGAFIGGLVATAVPESWLRVAMASMALLAVVRFAFAYEFEPPRSSYIVVGFVVGFVCATGGGGGLIAGPFLLAAGLSGPAYVGTVAFGSVAMHTGRLLAYGSGGAVSTETFALGAALAVAILAGNVLADRLRGLTPERWIKRIELGVVAGCVVLALVPAML